VRAEAPPRLSANPIVRVASDLLSERAARGTFPPGPADFDFQRTRVMARDPLSILLPLYREYGPIFSVRLLHSRVVFMLGPAANHFILVEHPEYFHWREGSFGDLIPLLGDGLLTIDGAYHDEARRIMMPAFHREQIMAATEVMFEEGEAALARWRPGETIDIYHWMRNVAMRIAMRALLGLDPDDRGQGAEAAEHFERALSYYGIDFHKRLLRGPGSPWRSMQRSRARLALNRRTAVETFAATSRRISRSSSPNARSPRGLNSASAPIGVCSPSSGTATRLWIANGTFPRTRGL